MRSDAHAAADERAPANRRCRMRGHPTGRGEPARLFVRSAWDESRLVALNGTSRAVEHDDDGSDLAAVAEK